MINKRPTQTERVLNYIKERGSITAQEAYNELGVMRLPSRIHELKRSGVDIVSNMEQVTNRYNEKCYIKRYRLGEANNEQ